MQDSDSLILLGYSGHAYFVLDVVESMSCKVLGYLDHNVNVENPYKLSYLGKEADFDPVIREARYFPAVGDNLIRQKLVGWIESKGLRMPCLVHRNSSLSKLALVGKGSVVGPGAVVNGLAQVGTGVIVNTAAVVEHECKVGDFVHLAPGAVLAGNVSVGKNTFIGGNAFVKQGLTIGANVIVGAGSVVLKNIPDGQTWVGNPAKRIN